MLMNELVPFAERMLREHGEFHPFGGKIIGDGRIVHIGADDGEDLPAGQDLIDLMMSAFREEARTDDLQATAIVANVLATPPEHDQMKDTIQIILNHREGYSAQVFIPYTLGEEIQFGTMFACADDNGVFARSDREQGAVGNEGHHGAD